MATDELEVGEPQVMQVRIINRNNFAIRDMFDGTEYVFEPSKPVAIPVDAAGHIFGWFAPYTDVEGKRHEPDPKEMRRHVMKRFGWNTPGMAETGDIFYDQLKLQPIIYRMVPVPVDGDDDPVPTASSPARRNNRLMAAADAAAARTG